jgi:hypothetical protein
MLREMARDDARDLTSRDVASRTVVVAVTNARFDTARRGLAVALAEQLGRATRGGVCLLEADRGDRDVERRLPDLRRAWGRSSSVRVSRGVHVVEIDVFDHPSVCVVLPADNTDLGDAVQDLRSMFQFVVVDAPSRLDIGTGRANAWIQSVDVVVLASDIAAHALGAVRRFSAQLVSMPYTRHLDVQVVLTGNEPTGERSRRQVEQRLVPLRAIARVPALWGNAAHEPASGAAGLEALAAHVVAHSERASRSA